MDKKQTFSLWYVLAALVGMILLQELVTTRHTQTLTYSEFKQALVAASPLPSLRTAPRQYGTIACAGRERAVLSITRPTS